MDLNEKEFKAFGCNIEKISLYYGIFLILWGIVVTFIAESSSMTSYIPSFFGLLIVLFSSLSIIYPNQRKIYMHIVALIGLVIMLGGLELLRGLISGSFLDNIYADISKLMMFITGAYFLYLCFLSFRFARKVKDLEN